jgi:asparagine synthase (glutamine-hydrolysing)
VAKLEPGFRLDAKPGAAATRSWIDATYAEDLEGSDEALARALRLRIVENVREYRPGNGAPWGAFLSGGTDSSSIAGILACASPAPVDSYSIGFAEDAFDEMGYSRIASRSYGLNAHERVIGEEDAMAILPRIVNGFDEPFGNASAIGTYYCADLARRTGKETLVAGDGGDEIFGGNERYAKDYVLGRYYRAPHAVHALGRVVGAALRPIDTSPTNRIRNILRRGALPNPERFYADDAFASECFEELLTPGFRQGIARDASLDLQRELFARPDTASELHRLMYLDLKLTLAESDIVKVVRSARMAGMDVAFPYLDRELVQYTGRFPERCKVKRTRKRYLFKKAMAGILPPQILAKKKQGFGLPVSVWLRRTGPMRELVNDVVLSPRALSRGYFDAGFVRRLIARHERGAWDHAQEIFRLLMLELWHREHLDARA